MKKKVSLSSFSHSLQIEKKSEIVLKRFSLSSALVGAAIIAINQSKNIFSIEWSRKSALRQKERRSARGVLHSIRADSDLSLSRARERGFHRLRTVPFFLTCEFSYLLKLDTQKVNSERNARARPESDEIFSRERVLRRRRRKRTHLNLGGLEAGDGRDLLSSSKHYVYRVDVFLCVWMTIFSRASNICISRITVLVKKRPSEDGTWGRRIEFFRKKREKRETYFQGEDGVCFMKSERADQAKVFQESAKKKTKILILAHVFTTLHKTHLHKHHVCCYSTNRVRRRPQGHQGSGTSEFRFASRAVKVDFERRRWEIFCYRESNQEKKEP